MEGTTLGRRWGVLVVTFGLHEASTQEWGGVEEASLHCSSSKRRGWRSVVGVRMWQKQRRGEEVLGSSRSLNCGTSGLLVAVTDGYSLSSSCAAAAPAAPSWCCWSSSTEIETAQTSGPPEEEKQGWGWWLLFPEHLNSYWCARFLLFGRNSDRWLKKSSLSLEYKTLTVFNKKLHQLWAQRCCKLLIFF